jgi:hypothetical protein
LIQWRRNPIKLNAAMKRHDAPFDSDLRKQFDLDGHGYDGLESTAIVCAGLGFAPCGSVAGADHFQDGE